MAYFLLLFKRIVWSYLWFVLISIFLVRCRCGELHQTKIHLSSLGSWEPYEVVEIAEIVGVAGAEAGSFAGRTHGSTKQNSWYIFILKIFCLIRCSPENISLKAVFSYQTSLWVFMLRTSGVWVCAHAPWDFLMISVALWARQRRPTTTSTIFFCKYVTLSSARYSNGVPQYELHCSAALNRTVLTIKPYGCKRQKTFAYPFTDIVSFIFCLFLR